MRLKDFDSIELNKANLRQWFPENQQFAEFIGRKLRKITPETRDLGRRLERISRLIQADPKCPGLKSSITILSNLKALVKTNLFENYWRFCPNQDRIVPLEEKMLFGHNFFDNQTAVAEMGIEKFGFLPMLKEHPEVMHPYLTSYAGRKKRTKELIENSLKVWKELNRLYPCEDLKNYEYHWNLPISAVMEEMTEKKRLHFLNTPCGRDWISYHIDDLATKHKEFLQRHFPIKREENFLLYESMNIKHLHLFEEEDLLPFLRSESARNRFERELSHVDLYNHAYPPSELENYHLYFEPEGLLDFSDEERDAYLKSPSGRKLAEQKTNDFFAEERLKEALLKAYPPEKDENFHIYVKTQNNEGHLFIKTLSHIVKVHTDRLLEKFFQIRDIHVSYFDTPAIDEGALRRQFVSDLIEGLLTGYSEICFSSFPYGMYPKAKNPLQVAVNEKGIFLELGSFFAFAIKSGIPIGERFHPKWLSCILEMVLWGKGKYSDILACKSDLELHQWLQAHIPTEEPIVQTMFEHAETVFVAESFEQALQSASTLNLSWASEELETALANQKLTEVKAAVRKNLLQTYEGYLSLSDSTIHLFEASLPLTIGGVRINSKADFAFITAEEFAFALQGRMDADWLKERIHVEGEELEAVENVHNWVQEWLETHREDRLSLKNLLLYLTGSAGLHGMLTFKLYNQADDIVVHACFSRADVKMTITKEELHRELDLYASGKLNGFTIV